MAFAGLNYHFKVDRANGNVVNSSSQISGNNRGAFDLTGLRMGVISATNKDFSTARENHTITVKDEMVSFWVVEPTEGAGLLAILKQLDVKLSKTWSVSILVHFGIKNSASPRSFDSGTEMSGLGGVGLDLTQMATIFRQDGLPLREAPCGLQMERA